MEKKMRDKHLFSRKRRANVSGGRQHSHQVKVSAEEEGRLLRLANAQGVSVPRLLVEAALASETGQTVSERRQLLAELFAIHRLLGSIANNVNQMAKATNATGELGKELSGTMRAVRVSAERIDGAVDRLGLS